MKYLLIPALSYIATAAPATLKTIDFFGKTLSQDTVEFEAGETFKAKVDLGVSNWELRELRLNTGSYGMNECRFLMKPMGHDHKERKGKSKLVEVGHFHTMCEWPNVITNFKSDTEFVLNVENIWQFYNEVNLWVECDAQDVTIAAGSKNLPCTFNKEETVQNNQVDNWTKYFWFQPLFNNLKMFIKESVGVYAFNLADIFLSGGSQALDVALQAGNLAIYKQSAAALFAANGLIPFYYVHNHEEGHEVSQDDIYVMAHGVMAYGFSIYGLETIVAAEPIVRDFLTNGFDSTQTLLFTKDFTQTNWKQYRSGALTFNADYYKTIEWYWRLHNVLMEAVACGFYAYYRPIDLVMWWPRLANAGFDFTLAFYQ